MRKSPRIYGHHSRSANWRRFQSELRRQAPSGPDWRRSGLRAGIIGLLTLTAVCAFYAMVRTESSPSRVPKTTAAMRLAAPVKLESKQDLWKVLDIPTFTNLTSSELDIPFNRQMLHIKTSLDEDLQNFLLENLDRENSRHIGIVAMEPGNGRILAMASYDRRDPVANPCLNSIYPAASLFKIVTAASAVDRLGYAADSPLFFNGAKHTLYKQQLTAPVNKNSNAISFRDAFAQSINPVFGKIGQQHMGKEKLEQVARAFGFNQPLTFDLALPPSHFQTSDDPYYWAELASGFNRDTTISPLHGAVMVSAVLNDGRMIAPSLVDQVADARGKVLYRGHAAWQQRAMSPEAARVLQQLMHATIESGTSRKAFRGYQDDRVLSRLEIGGKTGSISSRDREARFDWFVGFAREREGARQMIIAVMVAHEDYIGTRAGQYARMAMERYFGNQGVTTVGAPQVVSRDPG